MPMVSFSQLPDSGRVWVFASDRSLNRGEADVLLDEVDRFLDQWKAHGAPLRCARDWREDHFLAIGVDPTAEQASGCSIDGLFRALKALEARLATGLVAGGRVFYRDASARPRLALRNEIRTLFERQVIGEDTPVFDTSVTDVRSWRERFERPLKDSWVAAIVGAPQASQVSSRSATNSSSVRNG